MKLGHKLKTNCYSSNRENKPREIKVFQIDFMRFIHFYRFLCFDRKFANRHFSGREIMIGYGAFDKQGSVQEHIECDNGDGSLDAFDEQGSVQA